MTVTHPVRPAAAPPVGPADVRAARELLAGVVAPTPMANSRALSELCGGPVLLKCENLQRTGSFKIRGAYTRIARLDAGQRARGVVAASAGNHAQGVALAAQMLGVRATVFMPERAALPKVAPPAGYGATVHLVGATVDESLAQACAFAERTGAVLVHPFDHVDVIAGQGTVGLEIVEQCPDVATVLVPTGGGGLLGGVAAALKAGPACGWSACRPRAPPRGRRRWSRTRRCALPSMRTIADGIAVGRPGDVDVPAGHGARRRDHHRRRRRAVAGAAALPGAGEAARRAGGRGGGRRAAGAPAAVRHAGGRRALRRQHRSGGAAAT